MFLYGLSPKESNIKIKEILKVVSANTGQPCHLIISQHSITIIGIYPYRSIQIVLRNYRYFAKQELKLSFRTLSEVLIGFDIDCCSFGYNGENVFCTPRARRAVNRRCINKKQYFFETFRQFD